MTETEWLTSNDPAKMLEWLTGDAVYSGHVGHMTRRQGNRKLRLFVCACYQLIKNQLSEWNRTCLPYWEKYAENEASSWEIDTFNCRRAVDDHFIEWFTQHYASSLPTAAALLRCIFGNPYRPFLVHCPKCEGSGFSGHGTGYGDVCDDCGGQRITPEGYELQKWLSWKDGIVKKIAQTIYDDRTWDQMLILADSLEEAGCTNQDILEHCRNTCPICGGEGGLEQDTGGSEPWGEFISEWIRCEFCNKTGKIPSTHARGCWVIDLLLNKE